MDPTSVVRGLVELIPLAWNTVQNELKLAADAKKEFDDLKNLIEDIGRILNEAYSKEVVNEHLKPGIKRMREFLYDSEDAIEDLWRRKSKRRQEGPASSLHDLYNNRTFTVKSREIEQMWEDYTARLGRTTPIRNFLGLPINHVQSSSASRWSSSNAFFENTALLVGIGGPIHQLVSLLIEDLPRENHSMSKVIFVHGVQGVGKTSLVAAVLRHETVRNHFKCYVWIEDLRSCELANDTSAALMTANAKMWDFTRAEVNSQGQVVKLKDAFEHNLRTNNSSWVLILDDAGRADLFSSLLVHLNDTRPTVLVTTRVRSLPSRSKNILEAQYVSLSFEHCVLSENDSRILFCRKMFGKDTYEDDSRATKDASDLILRRCKGLPLVILATCKLLKYNKELDVSGSPDAVQWTDLSGKLEEELVSKRDTVDENGRMTLRMDHLLDARACVFYLSIFPVNCPIRCSTMMKLWMAERFIEPVVQDKAEKTLQKLLEHNVIQEKRTSYGRVKTGRVHNFLHQIIVSKSKDEEFTMIVASQVRTLPAEVRYLSFHCHLNNIDSATSVEQLRSLHVFKNVHPPSLEKLLQNVDRLKVVDFQRHLTKEDRKYAQSSLNTFPQKIFQSKYLRYLNLRGTDVKNVKRIENLTFLETLDLRGTLVDELPEGILELSKLCHLLVSRSKKSRATVIDLKHGVKSNKTQTVEFGVKAPSKLGRLKLLQELCMIELKPVGGRYQLKPVSGSYQCKRKRLLKELGKLTGLRRLGLSMLESTDAQLLCASIEKLTNLAALRLIVGPGPKIDLSKEELGQALKRLEHVHLTGPLENLPKWILCSDILVKLVLKWSELTVNVLDQLGVLPNLEHLELEQAFHVTEMKFKTEMFKKLHFLSLDGFDELKSMEVAEGGLPTLEKLSLARCNSLTKVPLFITRRTNLKCLKLWDMSKEFNIAVQEIKENLQQGMKVKSEKWKDPVVENVKPLPTWGTGISFLLRPFKK